MNYLPLLGLLLAGVACQVYAVGFETIQRSVDTLVQCQDKYSVEGVTVHDLAAFTYVPTSRNAKCMIDCWMEGVGYIQNGRPSYEEINRWVEVFYTDPEERKLSQEINKHCADTLQPTEHCEMGFELGACIIKASNELGLPSPKFINDLPISIFAEIN